MNLTSLEIAEYLGNMCSDNQTMVGFLESELNIEIVTKLRIIGSGLFETAYYYQKEYISSKGDANSSIIMGIWKYFDDNQKQILEDKLQKLLNKNTDLVAIADKYKEEKAKGGSNSYKAYKPLKEKTKELCLDTLSKRPTISAMQLADQVSKILEEKHLNLLEKFAPYQNYKNSGTGWTDSTFYNWCNDIRKSYNSK